MQLVLDGVSVTNQGAPVVYVKSAEKVFITTAAGSDNDMEVSGTFVADGETNLDAVIFGKDDLVLNGTGSLEIVSAQGNGITSKDDLKITGGSITVTSALDGLEANPKAPENSSHGPFCRNGLNDVLISSIPQDIPQSSIALSPQVEQCQ